MLTRQIIFLLIFVWIQPANATLITWTGDWQQERGFFGPEVAGAVNNVKEAFGISATKDEQITDTDKIPGVGKTELSANRIAQFGNYKVGASFERPFKLSEDSEVIVTAELEGVFKTTGAFVLGDFANARAVAEVLDANKDVIFGVVAFDTTDKDRKEDPNNPGQVLPLAPGQYEAKDSKTEKHKT